VVFLHEAVGAAVGLEFVLEEAFHKEAAEGDFGARKSKSAPLTFNSQRGTAFGGSVC
jgi:hypothetical protein